MSWPQKWVGVKRKTPKKRLTSYNSKVHRCCSGKRFVVIEVQVPNSQGAPQLLSSLNLKGLCTVETSFTNCFLFYCPMKTEAILQFYNKYWQEKRWSQTGEFVISKCPETNGRTPEQVPPLKNTQNTLTRTEGREWKSNEREREWWSSTGELRDHDSYGLLLWVYIWLMFFFSSQIKNLFLFLNFTTML